MIIPMVRLLDLEIWKGLINKRLNSNMRSLKSSNKMLTLTMPCVRGLKLRFVVIMTIIMSLKKMSTWSDMKKMKPLMNGNMNFITTKINGLKLKQYSLMITMFKSHLLPSMALL